LPGIDPPAWPGGPESRQNAALLQNRDRRCTGTAVAIDLDSLKSERDKLKDGLRELEAEQRKVEAELKTLRQREIQTKREIEALGTLIEIHEGRTGTKESG